MRTRARDEDIEVDAEQILIEKSNAATTTTTTSSPESSRLNHNKTTILTGVLKGKFPVAIKFAKYSQAEQLLNEIEMMRDIEHKHVVKLLGTCVCYSNNVFVCMESFATLDLRTFIRSQQARSKSTTQPTSFFHQQQVDKEMLLSMAHQICASLCYLAKKYVVHRDLACRNVFVVPNASTTSKSESSCFVKLGNFGLARHLDLNNQFIIKSDVKEGILLA